MPVRSLGELGTSACARLLVEAHKEFLDAKAVEFEQVLGLCEKLASMQTALPGKSVPDPPVAKPSATPQALDRGLLRQMEMDFNSGSELSPPAEADNAVRGRADALPPPSAVPRANGLPPPSAVPKAAKREGAGVVSSPRKGAMGQGAASKPKPKVASGEDVGQGKEKKGGKKKKAKKVDGEGWPGPSLNSLLGLSDEDEAPAAAPAKRGSMSSLKDMPSLF